MSAVTRRALLESVAAAPIVASTGTAVAQPPPGWKWDPTITNFATLKTNVMRMVERKGGISISTLTMLGDIEYCRAHAPTPFLSQQYPNGWLAGMDKLTLKGEGFLPQQEILIRQRERLSDCVHLKKIPRYRMKFLDPLLATSGALTTWIETQNWRFPWGVGNIDMDTAYAIAFDWKVMNNPRAHEALRAWFQWHDTKIDKRTGFWDLANTGELRNTMAGAMHQFGIYFLFNHELPYPERAAESTLRLQEPTGLFSADTFSHNCLDIDAVFVLTNIYHRYQAKQREIRACLERVFEANLKCFDPGGGAIHRVGVDNEPDWWSTWCRVAITGWCARILGIREFSSGPWEFRSRHPFQAEKGGLGLPDWEDDRWYDAVDWPRPVLA